MNLSSPESSLHAIVQSAEEDIKKADNLVTQSKSILQRIHKDLKDEEDIRAHVKEYVERLNVLQCTHQYMRVIQQIEYLWLEFRFVLNM